MKLSAIVLLLVSLSGCVAIRPFSRSASDEARIIENVPSFRWGDNTCGSAALSTVLTKWGENVSEQELDRLLDKGLHGGVVSLDLLLEARRRGFDAELIGGSEQRVRTEVEQGRPAILLLRVIDLPGRRADYFHYVVVDGLDPKKNLFHVQFGDEKNRWIPLRSIDRNWGAANRAMLVVRGRSSSVATAAEKLKRGVALEAAGQHGAAVTLYRELLVGDASNPLLLTNLGNALNATGKRDEAEQSYRAALAVSPDYRDALNNLAWLLYERQRYVEAEELARRAVAAPGPDDFAPLSTLGDVLAAEQKCDEAVDIYRRAFDSVPPGQVNLKATTLLGMGRAQKRCGRAADAKNSWTLATQIGPDAETAKQLAEELAR